MVGQLQYPNSPASLERRIDRGAHPDEILDAFLGWVREVGLEPYAAQEEALLEVMSDRHLILNTPTGSGKSLIALAVHFRSLCEGLRSYYTSPIKALVNEKFFALCDELGAHNVGLLTGDASVNPRAPVVCCTAEVLANFALRDGVHAQVDFVVMDEFHFYADPDRGIAWQIPLLTLPHATFVLMSATLGDVSDFERRIEAFTHKPVSVVRSVQRPVPLDFEYSERPLHEAIDRLVAAGKAPIYLVNFTQREAADVAQNLTSINLCTKEEKSALADAIGEVRFDTVYGKDIKRFLKHGVGLHHAGLLPKYRTLVERLAQKGMLKVISGTDTLGVGINVPIRSVLFTQLCKFDGQKTRLLSVREFKQIAGRAGRKGFDDAGSVVAQAPAHVIENKRAEAKAGDDAKKRRKIVRKKPPDRGYVHWDESTYKRLVEGLPEALESQFNVSHGLLLSVLSRELDESVRHGGYRRVVELIHSSYERPGAQRHHRRVAARLFRDLRAAGVVAVVSRAFGTRSAVRVAEGLQEDFSLNHTLSLYLVDALDRLDPEAPTYALDVLTLVEAILEQPHAVLRRQLAKCKADLIARCKAEGMEYEQRMQELERVEHPKPNAEFLYRTFDAFRAKHPWIASDNVRPKSVARDMFERFAGFNEYVKLYGLGPSEGVLLRYLTQAYKTLVQNVPDTYKTEAVEDIAAFLRATLARVDSSLVTEWERMVAGESSPVLVPGDEPAPLDPSADPRAFRSRLRAEMHALVKALATADYDEAVNATGSQGDNAWSADQFAEAMAPVLAEHGEIVFDHRARWSHLTRIAQSQPRLWIVQQTLVGKEGETSWMVEAEVDLRPPFTDDRPLLQVIGISA